MTQILVQLAELEGPPERTVMTNEAEDSPPLVDKTVLERLKTELEDNGDGYTRIFVANFIQCFPHRLEKLRLALTTGDLDGAMDAVLSLKTSCQMVGADRLASLAVTLEASLRSDSTRSDVTGVLPKLAASSLTPIRNCGKSTMYRLKALGAAQASR